MRQLTALGSAALFLWACSGTPLGSGLTVTVKFAPASNSRCVIVGVTREDSGAGFESQPLLRVDRDLIVGVEPSALLSGKVIPYAHGFTTADCTGQSWAEEAVSPVSYDLGTPGVQQASLTLDGTGRDGGGADGGCVPTSSEVCDDGVDNDCNGLLDCLDLVPCQGHACNDLDACTQGDICRTDGTCRGTPKACTSPGQCEVLPGACSEGACAYDAGTGLSCNGNGICRSDKSCADAGIEVFCANGLDDDSDGLTDCADPDCNQQTCDAGPSRCFATAQCIASVCMKKVAIACAPPTDCFVSSGACNEDGGCPFAPRDAGSACDGGVCRVDGGCSALEICNNNVDDNGNGLVDCADPDCAAQACDDNNACTSGTVCSGGSCGGGTVCAAPPLTCFANGACQSDGGCSWLPQSPSLKCDGGTCQVDGGCASGFPYAPSNFNPSAIPDASIAPSTTFSNCTATFNSTTNTFNTWCNQTLPTPVVLTQDGGGGPVVVLAMADLTITNNANLTLSGDRPVILAVYGPVLIQGTLEARSVDTSRKGPGANWSGCGALAGGNGTSLGGGGGGAFGSSGSSGGSAGGGSAGFADGGQVSLSPLHGGCPGGNGSGGAAAGTGGVSGGAVQISSSLGVTVEGVVSASGAGGLGGKSGFSDNGGGGAGSGGAILLEGWTLDLKANAKLIANGGAGGGGRQSSQNDGSPGQDGTLNNTSQAAGGTGSGTGGTGANGAAGTSGPTTAQPGTGGAGAGGGGAGLGRVRLNAANTCTIASGVLFSAAVSKPAPCP